jgi:hypothetical protein
MDHSSTVRHIQLSMKLEGEIEFSTVDTMNTDQPSQEQRPNKEVSSLGKTAVRSFTGLPR